MNIDEMPDAMLQLGEAIDHLAQVNASGNEAFERLSYSLFCLSNEVENLKKFLTWEYQGGSQ